MKRKIVIGALCCFTVILSFIVSMKLFLLFILLGLLCFIVLFILNNKVKKTNWYKNVIPDLSNYPNNKWYRNHLERNYDLAIIGSSSAVYSYNVEKRREIKFFNWANKPQSLPLSYKVLKTYFSILKKKGLVIITLCPFSGLDADSVWSSNIYDKYFYILNSEDIPNYCQISRRRRYPILFTPIASLKGLIKDFPVLSTMDKQPINFKLDATRWINIWKKEFDIECLNEKLTKDNEKGMLKRVALLKEMISFCLDRELRPILVIPPVHEELFQYFTENFRQNYIENFITDVCSGQQIPFFNFLGDTRFYNDYYFSNAYFLNEKGAEKFTTILLEKLKIN